MSASALPLELLLEIFQRVYKDDFGRALHVPDARGSAVPQVALRLYARADLHSCLFVCRSWYYAAVKVLWEDPDFVRVASFDRLLRYLDQPRCRCRRRRRRRRPSGPGLGPAARPDDDLDDTAAARTAVGRIGLVQVRRVHIVSSPVLLDNSTWLATYLTDAHLDVLRANLGLLTSLSLKDCRGITDSAVCALVAKVGRRLKSLDLSGCRTLGDVTVQAVAEFCGKSLEHLSLRCCGLVSDVGAAYIASVCGANGTLKSLDLSWCRRVSDAAVVNLVNQCAAYRGPLKRMRHPPSGPPAPPPSGAPAPPRPPSPPPPPPRARRGPDESRAPAAHARDVTAGRDLRNLRSLSVVGCRGITRAGILSILRMLLSEPASENAAAAPPAGGLLEELEFSCPVPTSSRVPYMFSSLEHALALFRNLRKLTIHNAMYMSSQMLSTLVSNLGQDDESDFDDGTGAGARRAAAPALRSLNLVQCKALNDKHMMVLLSRCSRLEELRIPGARGVSDSTLQELSAAGCADHLRVLNLDDCVNLSDHGLAALASTRKAPGSGAGGKRSRKPPRAWYRTEEWRPAASGLRPPPPPPQAGFAAASDWWGFPNLEELSLVNCRKITSCGVTWAVTSVRSLGCLNISGCGDGIFTFRSPESRRVSPSPVDRRSTPPGRAAAQNGANPAPPPPPAPPEFDNNNNNNNNNADNDNLAADLPSRLFSSSLLAGAYTMLMRHLNRSPPSSSPPSSSSSSPSSSSTSHLKSERPGPAPAPPPEALRLFAWNHKTGERILQCPIVGLSEPAPEFVGSSWASQYTGWYCVLKENALHAIRSDWEKAI